MILSKCVIPSIGDDLPVTSEVGEKEREMEVE